MQAITVKVKKGLIKCLELALACRSGIFTRAFAYSVFQCFELLFFYFSHCL
jgi:hypothetical protein